MADSFPKQITIKKYGRYWAIYADSELLAVAVYKKGALAAKSLIESLIAYVNREQKI